MARIGMRRAGKADDLHAGSPGGVDAMGRILDHQAARRIDTELLRAMQKDVRLRLDPIRSQILGRIDMRREIGFEADLGQHHVQPCAGGIGADAALGRQPGKCELHALDDLHIAFQPGIEQLFRLVEQRGGKRNIGFLLDAKQDVLPGHAGKTLTHFLDADRVTGFRQQLGFHPCSNDFGIDEHAVAIEEDEVETAHDGDIPF
ncbi:hypothetical protein D3C87_1586040 [compost metagenome]